METQELHMQQINRENIHSLLYNNLLIPNLIILYKTYRSLIFRKDSNDKLIVGASIVQLSHFSKVEQRNSRYWAITVFKIGSCHGLSCEKRSCLIIRFRLLENHKSFNVITKVRVYAYMSPSLCTVLIKRNMMVVTLAVLLSLYLINDSFSEEVNKNFHCLLIKHIISICWKQFLSL